VGAATLVALSVCPTLALPNFHGCADDISRQLDYCDETLPIDERVRSLLALMNLTEKIYSFQPQEVYGNLCGTTTGQVDRVGLPQYTWLIETNTNVASACMEEGKCATCFVGPMAMGSSFNHSSWRAKGMVFGNEMRAFNNLRWHRTTNDGNDFIGLTGYGPNINIARDPRFGRNSELPGEDPFLNGNYATSMVQGMQEEDANGHPKMIAYLKHLTAYSTETNRGHDDYTISPHDLFETYLPAYERAFTEGKASGAMCSYNAINGAPSCANDYILNQVVRGMWAPDAHITTDCGAVANLRGEPVNAPSDEAAASMALGGGADIDMGDTTMSYALESAVDEGLLDEAQIDAAWTRSFTPLFKAGRFDSVDSIEWTKLGKESINSELHQQISYEAALQGQVLLKNSAGTLPLPKASKIAVLGPMALDPSKYLSSYAADDICFGGDHHCMTSIARAIEASNDGTTTWAAGVDINSNRTNGIPRALKLAEEADYVVLCVGIDNTEEHEGLDREDTALPGVQEEFAQAVLATGAPTIMVLVNGGTLAIDNLVDGPSAIVEIWNPAVMGPAALAAHLFAEENRWGKLPVTMYPHNFIYKKNMTDYDMSLSPGRTYKYYDGTAGDPLFAFGHGLSLTEFELRCVPAGASTFEVGCHVENVGAMDGDEVVQVYHKVSDEIRKKADHAVPLKSLIGFKRVRVPKASKESVGFTFTSSDFELVNQDGDKVLYDGEHTLVFSRGHGDEVELTYSVGGRH